jgi:hypothetical protein
MMDLVIPLPEDAGRAMTIAENKRNEILNLYRDDARSAPWNGTAFGVLQAFNTWNHHFATVKKGVPRICGIWRTSLPARWQTLTLQFSKTLALACK